MKALFSAVVLAAASAVMEGCHTEQSTPIVTAQTMKARVVESEQKQTAQTVSANGTLHARETAVLSAQVVGRVQQVLVREGDVVAAGQTLIVLDDATLRSAAEQAEAAVRATQNQQVAAQTNADLAASTLARYKQLQEQKSVSPQEMDEVTRRAQASAAQVDALRAQEAAAQAQVSGAHATLGYTRIRAPFSGVVTARMVDPGAMAAPGVGLLQIDSGGTLQMQTTVDESIIAAIHNGMKLNISFDGNRAQASDGTVAEIFPAADPSSHSFKIEINLASSKQLRAGMYGTVEIPTGVRNAIFVPRSAVVIRGSLPCAYVLDANGIAQLRYLTQGAAQGNFVEILSGISAGEKLIDDPADREFAGKRIEVQL